MHNEKTAWRLIYVAQLIITQLTENAVNYIAHFVKVITFILCDE